LQNAVRIQDATFQEALFDYQNTVLQAQREVEDAIATMRTTSASLGSAQRAADASQRAVQLANAQYRAGSVGFDSVLNASRSMLHDRDALALNQGQLALAAVSLYRALGGGWQVAEGRQVVNDGAIAEMEKRTNWGRLIAPPDYSPLARKVEDADETKK
jgi:outer membrane protein TolC